MKMNTYENESGYEIRATEKAYKLFYEKQGFHLKEKKTEEPKKRKSAAERKAEKAKADLEENEKSGKEDTRDTL